MNEIIQIVIKYVIEAVALVAVFLVGKYVLPWLKQKGLYEIILQFVQAAEQKADAGFINPEARKEDVIAALQKIGVKITEQVLELIEAAVLNVNLEKKSVESSPVFAADGLLLSGEAQSEPMDGDTESKEEPAAQEAAGE